MDQEENFRVARKEYRVFELGGDNWAWICTKQ